MANEGNLQVLGSQPDTKTEPTYVRFADGRIFVKITDTSGTEVYIDTTSGAMGTIDQEHLMVHMGNAYKVVDRSTIDDSGGTTPHKYYLINVPASVYPHLRYVQVSSDGGPFDVQLSQGPTDTGGVALTPQNCNRNYTNSAGTVWKRDPSVTLEGTVIDDILVPATKQQGGFNLDTPDENILKPSTEFLIKITNNTSGAGTSNFVMRAFFYEG